jgi:D-alanyl-D-alanine dipeptidase
MRLQLRESFCKLLGFVVRIKDQESARVDHRLILRQIMSQAGFVQLPIEWWHYDALTGLAERRA